MAKFNKRTTAPSKGDKNFIHYEKGGYNICIVIDEKTGYVLPNCVGYAHGRLLEQYGKNAVNWKIPACNAEDWFETAQKNGFEVGQTPRLGAVAVWSAGKTKNGADGAGHVAVVEEIKANGDIVTSNSAYGGNEFYLKTITKESGYTYSKVRKFLGFIYSGIEYEEETTIKAGMKVELNNTPCYSAESSKGSYGVKSGTFYLWDDVVKSGRIRITNKPERVGVKGQVTCWVAVADIGLATEQVEVKQAETKPAEPTIKAGQKYIFKNVPVYSSESGATIGDRTGTYYTWDDAIKNGRIRMTNDINRVGVKGKVSFWADITNLK